jgi:Tfp pilus assembly protein PilO
MTEQEHGLVGLGGKLIGSLPGQFLALLAVVAVLVLGLFWHLDNQLDARERVLEKMIAGCLPPQPH